MGSNFPACVLKAESTHCLLSVSTPVCGHGCIGCGGSSTGVGGVTPRRRAPAGKDGFSAADSVGAHMNPLWFIWTQFEPKSKPNSGTTLGYCTMRFFYVSCLRFTVWLVFFFCRSSSCLQMLRVLCSVLLKRCRPDSWCLELPDNKAC